MPYWCSSYFSNDSIVKISKKIKRFMLPMHKKYGAREVPACL